VAAGAVPPLKNNLTLNRSLHLFLAGRKMPVREGTVENAGVTRGR